MAGAILIDPRAQRGATGLPTADAFASPTYTLPFASIVVDAGANRLAQSAYAREWGSEMGSPNPADAPRTGRTLQFLERLTGAIVEREVCAAERLAAVQRKC